MKIILSPTKTQTNRQSNYLETRDLIFPEEHRKLQTMMNKLSKQDISRIMKLNGKLLDQTYHNIREYKNNSSFKAFFAFDGLVFKNIDKTLYKDEEYDYIEKHLCILDAYHGILEPGTLIKPYRLDMKMNIGVNLYKYWNVSAYFTDEIIINLASTEFSKMITSPNMITISFLQEKDGKFVNQATYSKMQRGKIAHYMIMNKITDLKQIVSYQEDDYIYNSTLSNEQTIVFTR